MSSILNSTYTYSQSELNALERNANTTENPVLLIEKHLQAIKPSYKWENFLSSNIDVSIVHNHDVM